MIGAAFRMPDDHVIRARIAQHFSADIAGVRTGGFGVAILPANAEAVFVRRLNRRSQKRRRRADEDFAPF